MSYSYDYATADTGFSSGWGNCSTYAEMFQLMCNDVGIPCNRVSGIANGANGWGVMLGIRYALMVLGII